jgi:hypothetical protein
MKAVEIAIMNKLKGNSSLTTKLGGEYIYNTSAPPGQSFDYVIYQWAGGGPENITPSDMRDLAYLVKGVSDNQKTAAEIDELIEDAMHKQTLTISGYTNLRTWRDNQVQLAEKASDGTLIFHRGAYYRIRIDD